jgi:hypothetical protein
MAGAIFGHRLGDTQAAYCRRAHGNRTSGAQHLTAAGFGNGGMIGHVFLLLLLSGRAGKTTGSQEEDEDYQDISEVYFIDFRYSYDIITDALRS